MNNTNYILAKNQTLETTRLILRKIQIEDAPRMFEYASDLDVVEYLTFPVHQSIEDTEKSIADFFMPNYLTSWGIVEKSSGKFIGAIDIRLGQKIIAEFGWVLAKNVLGKGYMPEAAACLRDLCFNELDIKAIISHHDSKNPKSGRVMEKIGMNHLGQIWAVGKDEQLVLSEYYGLSLEEYKHKMGD
ncbi:MAG: GNAT family N-acetyltransferase [Streptococcaceae bacterium]|jgi:ribosomal-protein-alanine N-acetyltransferase|nr:GNAT family N-acetyltransferase [Streptococcaceae bacterium]